MKNVLLVMLSCAAVFLMAVSIAISQKSERKQEPLCKPFSEFRVGKEDLNKSISPCNLYFMADAFFIPEALFPEREEKYFRVIIRRGKPIQIGENGEPVFPADQLLP